MVAFQQMLVLFIIMMIGCIAYKTNLITDETGKKLSGIVVNISNPAMILSSVIGNDTVTGNELIITMCIAGGMYVFLIAAAMIMPVILRVPKESAATYRVMTIFSNIGFMGFPIISSLYGSNALLYGALFLMPYNVLIYTYGVHELTRNNNKKDGSKKIKWGQIFNIGVIFCIAAIIIFAFNIKLPEWINTTISMLSGTTAPLSMLVIGASLATMNFKKMFCNIRMWVFSFIKMMVMPVIGTLLVRTVTDNSSIIGVTMVMLSVPVGSMTAMLASEYDGDYVLSSEMVAMTTLLSVVTFPVVVMLLEWI